MIRRPPRPTLFPNTTLSRSDRLAGYVESAWEALESGGELTPELDAYRRDMEDVARRLRELDRKSTRLNSSHANISYAVFCLKKKKTNKYDGDTRTCWISAGS